MMIFVKKCKKKHWKLKCFPLKENVTKKETKLEKIRASKNTIVEVITGKESEEEVESIVAEENKNKNSGHKPIDEACSDKVVVVYRKNENMSLDDIIREKGWLMCKNMNINQQTK